MEKEYYISQSGKLEKSLKKYLHGIERPLIKKYGIEKAQSIISKSKAHYPEIIKKMPFFHTPIYDSLIVLNSKMMALKKGMKAESIGVEEFVSFSIENLKRQTSSIPGIIRKLAGKLFLSKLVQIYLKKTAQKASENGWPTELINGTKTDDFTMKVCTKDCQMVNFMCSLGEEDIIPYCSFADFANAEALGFSLKQTSTIESGTCTFCFNKKGKIHWPESMQEMVTKFRK